MVLRLSLFGSLLAIYKKKMLNSRQFMERIRLYHGKSAKVAGNPQNFKKSLGNHLIMEGMNGIN